MGVVGKNPNYLLLQHPLKNIIFETMRYNFDGIDKIVDNPIWSERQKLDELLRIDCALYTNLGIDSTQAERDAVKRMSRAIYRRVKKVNELKGQLFIETMDSVK